jgi:Zn-dependent M28 family amino/carboxypeptidase
MLELARYYSRFHNNKYTLLFVAFSGEEFGMLGSTELSKRLQDNIITGMINLEMLGRPENKQCIIIGNDEDKVADTLNSVLPDRKSRYPYFIADRWISESLLTRSDHYPFLKSTDFCFTIMGTPPDDRFYHTVDDEYKTIDFKEMQKIALRILNGTASFINILPRKDGHYNL